MPDRGALTYVVEDFLPLKGRNLYERRMRVHQQWWGWRRLWRKMGQPTPRLQFPVLTASEQRDPATSNFLSASIHRLATRTLGLASFVHFNHLLSSMPMAINLFGVLVDTSTPFGESTPLDGVFGAPLRTPFAPSARSHQLVSGLLGRTVEVLRVDFEIPGRLRLPRVGHPLLDQTSIDVLVEFREPAGLGILAIETKLTEALSNGAELMDATRRYRALFDSSQSPFSGPLSLEVERELAGGKLVQWARNQLLAFGVSRAGGYASHSYWVVFPSAHRDAAKAAQVYSTRLKSPKAVFAALTVEFIAETWSSLLTSPTERDWYNAFRERYLAFEQSELLWLALTER